LYDDDDDDNDDDDDDDDDDDNDDDDDDVADIWMEELNPGSKKWRGTSMKHDSCRSKANGMCESDRYQIIIAITLGGKGKVAMVTTPTTTTTTVILFLFWFNFVLHVWL
jgi:hypothetical protein